MHSGANDTFNQVHIYDTSVQFYICSTFTSLYLLHMYTDVHMDKYMFFCGVASACTDGCSGKNEQ